VNVRRSLKDPAVQVRVGLVFLVLASLARFLLHPAAGRAADVMDAVEGFLYGVAIAAMLVGFARGGLRGRPGGAR